MFESIWTNLVSAAIFAGLGFLVTKLSAKLPNRALWKFSSPSAITICVAESAAVDTGKYIRKTTGIGQVRALATITPSLAKAHGRIDTHYIQLANTPLGVKTEGDLVCLGGVKNNAKTRDILKALAAHGYDVPQMEGSSIHWTGGEGRIEYKAITENGIVTRDFGLIVRAPNPFGPKHTAIVLAGASTYGVVAAARYFVDKCKFQRGWFAAVVHSRIQDEHVCPPEVVQLKPMKPNAS